MGKSTRQFQKQESLQEIESPDRRQFILSGLTLLVPSPLIQTTSNPQWSFVDRLKIPRNGRDVKTYVALGPEGPSTFESIPPETLPLVKSPLNRIGYNPQVHKIEVTAQYYGVPDEEGYTKPLLEYCRKAEELLKSKLRGLKSVGIDWVVLHNTGSFTSGINNKGFVGNSYYIRNGVRVVGISDKKIYGSFNAYTHMEGGFSLAFETGVSKTKEQFLFVGCGPSSLNSAIAEILHLFTLPRMEQGYKKDFLSLEEAVLTNEALAEGVSYFLAGDLIRGLSIPNGQTIVNETIRLMANRPEHRYVKESIAWIQRNGVQQAYDLYMKSPREFRNAISRMQ